MLFFDDPLSILTNRPLTKEHIMTSLDASAPKITHKKAYMLRNASLLAIEQSAQLRNPDTRISLEKPRNSELLVKYADSYAGILNGDSARFRRFFWEVTEKGDKWEFLQSTVKVTQPYAGREGIILWENGQGQLRELAKELRERLHDADRRGNQAWGKRGISVSQMGVLPCTLYTGELFDNNTAVILPKNLDYLPAIWAFCQSPEFNDAVRRIDQKMNVTNATLVKVPFDLEKWQKVADTADLLPEPYSNDPTQWLFKGNPVASTEPLQVAVARLLGYRWPQQKSDNLDNCAVKGGIICIPSVAGEESAVERLRVLLAAAYGEAWSPMQQDRLLVNVGFGGKSLDLWLRDGFFAQHCSLFHNRPFIWQIWDGLKDGFSALVNYHQLDAACLDRLIYTYLGSWIMTQKAERDADVPGAEARLVGAINLQKKLEAIRDGEPPNDIYVRWKPLCEQPMGWNPDLNDGVRINIRPLVLAGILRNRFTINWNKDRGTNPDGSERLNDLHYSLAEKREARQVTIQ